MTQLSQLIFNEYQIRKTKKQKDRFISLLQQDLPRLKVQEGGFPKCRNLVLGDPETAKVILSAHYDTCARLPFPNFIMPKNPLLTILYSILTLVPAFALVTAFSLLLARFLHHFWLDYILTLFLYAVVILFMLAGPANKRNANDNTSGVITLLEIYQSLTPQQKDAVCMVFFDNEEKGVLGSARFRRLYKKQLENMLLINFDCVSDGDHFLLGISKKANSKYRTRINRAFKNTAAKHVMLERLGRIYYPSDQAGFPMAISVAALKHKKFLGYYMNRIHTPRDTVFDEDNITYLRNATVKFIEEL